MNELDRQQEQRSPQTQNHQPGRESEMTPEPNYIRDNYTGSGKLTDKVAIISGGDSGIGRAVAVHFAREGANVAIIYLGEDEDDNTPATWLKNKIDGAYCLRRCRGS